MFLVSLTRTNSLLCLGVGHEKLAEKKKMKSRVRVGKSTRVLGVSTAL